MKHSFLLLLIILSIAGTLNAQHDEHADNEIAIVPGIVYDTGHKDFNFIIHGHYLRKLPFLKEKISMGAGIEFVTGEESHYTFGPVFAFEPLLPFRLLYSPGISILKDKDEKMAVFSNHLELALEFHISESMHLGPSVGANISKEDKHISSALHFGIGF